MIKPHIAREMRKHIDKHGPKGLDKAYAEWKSAKADDYEFSETDINALGYYYMGIQNYDAALAVFHVNVLEYPGSSNVWDSYGEALMMKGDTAAAIVNYQKSVEMNPGNTNGIMMLEKMGVKVTPVEVKVPTAVLEAYVGTYTLAPGFNIVVTRNKEQLFGQATGQAAFEMFAKTETEFFLKVVDAKVRFNKDDLGNVISMTLFQNGQVIEGMKN
jgi:tetratricopeptide (TPR) repeat protein